MLQTRSGKRTAFAALRIAVEMVDERLIDKKTAISRIDPDSLNQLLAPIFDPQAKAEAIQGGKLLGQGPERGSGSGLPGRRSSTPNGPWNWPRRARRPFSSAAKPLPEDIHGMNAAEGILTSRGRDDLPRRPGRPGHGEALRGRLHGPEHQLRDRLHGGQRAHHPRRRLRSRSTERPGEVIEGLLPTSSSEIVQVLIEKKIQPKDSLIYQQFAKLMSWADEIADLGVRTNADTPRDATVARLFGATGIGLCRTEHMFFEAERIAAVREMILADTQEERRRALAKILPMQRNDFIGIFRAMDGYPVIIRTLDPPLHEFLPHTDEEIGNWPGEMGVSFEKLKERAESLKEANPMLGHRGCRLGHQPSGDHRDAGPGDLRGRLRSRQGRGEGHPRGHDSPRGSRQRAARRRGRSSTGWPRRSWTRPGRRSTTWSGP